MQIFLDTVDSDSLALWEKRGIIDGVTTNPSLVSHALVGHEKKDPTQLIKTIATIMNNKPVSVEVTEQDPELVYKQAFAIAALAKNIVVKIPADVRYYSVIKQLLAEGILINVTLVFTLPQALMMCKLGVTYISPFVGRLEDIAGDGTSLLYSLRSMIDHYHFSTKILAASLRTVDHVCSAIDAGADVATLSVSLLEKALQHPLTQSGMVQFLADWQKQEVTTFPE